MSIEKLCKKAYNAMMDMDEDEANDVLESAIDDGENLTELLSNGFSAAMQELGNQFGSGEIFLPDLMFAAEIMQTASSRIESVLLSSGEKSDEVGKMIFATVEGDVHDIGKRICCTLLKANGVNVIDVGNDVPADKIVDAAEKFGATIIGLSALLTTTMIKQKAVIDLLKARNVRDKYKVMVGGAPVNQRWADEIGADGYTEDATACTQCALKFFGA